MNTNHTSLFSSFVFLFAGVVLWQIFSNNVELTSSSLQDEVLIEVKGSTLIMEADGSIQVNAAGNLIIESDNNLLMSSSMIRDTSENSIMINAASAFDTNTPSLKLGAGSVLDIDGGVTLIN